MMVFWIIWNNLANLRKIAKKEEYSCNLVYCTRDISISKICYDIDYAFNLKEYDYIQLDRTFMAHEILSILT